MGTLQDVLSQHSISQEAVVRKSSQLEARGQEGRVLGLARYKKRKTAAEKTYLDANIAKPALGRGVSSWQLQAAVKDIPVSQVVRSKIRKAVNAILTKKGKPELDALALFGAVPVQKGTKASSN